METINYIVSLMPLLESNMQPESQNQQMERNVQHPSVPVPQHTDALPGIPVSAMVMIGLKKKKNN